MSARKKLLLIVNPCAGTRRIVGQLPDVVRRLSAGGYDVDVKFTQATGDATDYVLRLWREYALIVCSGGDGTLNECVCGLMQLAEAERPPIGYIPAGSTNDFAVSLKLPTDIGSAADRIVSGQARALDAGAFGARHFMYVASFGAFTESSYSTSQNLKNVLGHTAYILDGIRSLGSIGYTELEGEADGEAFSGRYIFGSVSNSTSLGGVFKLKSGLVDFSDGRFELLLVRYPSNAGEFMRILQSMSAGNFEDKSILFRHVQQARFRFSQPTAWSLDGEGSGPVEEVSVQTCAGALRMIL